MENKLTIYHIDLIHSAIQNEDFKALQAFSDPFYKLDVYISYAAKSNLNSFRWFVNRYNPDTYYFRYMIAASHLIENELYDKILEINKEFKFFQNCCRLNHIKFALFHVLDDFKLVRFYIENLNYSENYLIDYLVKCANEPLLTKVYFIYPNLFRKKYILDYDEFSIENACFLHDQGIEIIDNIKGDIYFPILNIMRSVSSWKSHKNKTREINLYFSLRKKVKNLLFEFIQISDLNEIILDFI